MLMTRHTGEELPFWDFDQCGQQAFFLMVLSYMKQLDNFLFATGNWKMSQSCELDSSEGTFLSSKKGPLP